jgi:hypothetical protein
MMKNSTVASISLVVLVAALLFSTIDFSLLAKVPKVYIYFIGIGTFMCVAAFILYRSRKHNEAPVQNASPDSRFFVEDFQKEIDALQSEYYRKAMELRDKHGANADYQGLRFEYQKKIFDVHNRHAKRV